MENTAREAMTKFVLEYIKENWNKLNVINRDVDLDIFEDLKNDEHILDWILSEVLYDRDFKELGITLKTNYDVVSKEFEAIYKIGNEYIRQFKKGHKAVDKYNYEFVEPIEEIVITYKAIHLL